MSLIINGALFLRNKGKIGLLVILLVQIIMVSLKADNLFETTWNLILTPLLSVSLFTFSAMFFLCTYAIMLYKCDYHSFQIKRFSLTFLMLSLLGICCIECVILGKVYLDIPLSILSIWSLSVSSTISIYLWASN